MRHKVDSKRVLALLDKAVISTSLKDKNDLVAQIQKLWAPQNEGFESLQKVLSIKTDELASIQSQLQTSTVERDTFRKNTSFVSRVADFRTRHPKQILIGDIQSLESEIATYHEVQFPNKLNDALAITNEDEQLFALLDLSLHRREELAYAVKKRLFIVEQSQDATEEVRRDFNSIPQLIQKVEECEKENEELRNEEKQFISNSITKRRKFAALSPFCARELAVAFGEMLNAEKNACAELSNAEYEESDCDIEKLLKDIGFTARPMEFEMNEYANTTEPDTVAALIEHKDPIDKLKAYRRLNESTQAQIHKLIGEVEAVKGQTVYPPEGERSRIGRLIGSNERLLSQVEQINAEIDEKQADVLKEAQMFAKAVREREQASLGMMHRIRLLKGLMNSHTKLQMNAKTNKNIVSFLYHLVCAMGKDIVAHNNESELAGYLQARFLSLTARMQAEEAARMRAARPPTPPATEGNEPEALTVAELQERLRQVQTRKRRKTISRRKASVSEKTGNMPQINIDSVKQPESPPVPNILLSCYRPRIEAFHGLAMASEVAGFVVGVDRPFRKRLNAMIRPCIKNVRSSTDETLSEFGNGFRGDLNRVNVLQNSILVKSKETVSVQTDAVTREDIVIQTEEPQVAARATKPKSKK